jgi:hypothetical protein
LVVEASDSAVSEMVVLAVDLEVLALAGVLDLEVLDSAGLEKGSVVVLGTWGAD